MVSDSLWASIRESTQACVKFKSSNPEAWKCLYLWARVSVLPKSSLPGSIVTQVGLEWNTKVGRWLTTGAFKWAANVRSCTRQRGGGDLAVSEMEGDRCLMESRITDLPGITCNHPLLRFPLSSPLLLDLLQGQRLGEDGDFQISS